MSLYVPNNGNKKEFIEKYGGSTSSTKVKWFDHMREAYFYVDTPATKLKKKDQKNLSWQHTAHDVFLGAPFGK